MALTRCIGYNEFGYTIYHVPVWIQKTNGVTSIYDFFCSSEEVTKGEISIGYLELGIKTTTINTLTILELKHKDTKYYNIITRGDYWINNNVYHKVIKYFEDGKDIVLKYKYGKCCNWYFYPPEEINAMFVSVEVTNFPEDKIADIYTLGKEVKLGEFTAEEQKDLAMMYLWCVINSLIMSGKLYYDICDIFIDNEYLYTIFEKYKNCNKTTHSTSCLYEYYSFYIDMIGIYLSSGYAKPMLILANLSKFGINCINKTIGPETLYVNIYDTGFENKYVCRTGTAVVKSVDFSHASEVISNINSQVYKDIQKRFNLK